MTEAGGTPAAGGSAGQASGSPADLTSVLRSRGYHALLLAAALIGLPIALIAFGFAVVLMLEVVGFAGRQVLLVLLLCLVSSGIGALIFTGMGHWTGISVPSLQIPGLPARSTGGTCCG